MIPTTITPNGHKARLAPNERPWHVGHHYQTDIHSRQGFIAECKPLQAAQSIANAEFIVRAVNAHDDLVAALQLFMTCYPAAFAAFNDEQQQLIRGALTKAEVGQ